jgi:Recombinase zinc beta ribbon domain
VRYPGVAHEPLISPEMFEAARARRATNGRTTIRKPRRTPRPYLLRGRLRCGLCDRRMQGSWNHKQAYYRCRYPTGYALPRRAQHPRTVYVREAQIVPPLDDWIAGVFEPDRLEETCRALVESQEPPVIDDDRASTVRQVLVDCDARLPATGRRSRPEPTRPSWPNGSARSKLSEGRPRRNSGDVAQRPLSPRTTSARSSRVSRISLASWRRLSRRRRLLFTRASDWPSSTNRAGEECW